MGNYTTLELEVVIKSECRDEIKNLDGWLKQAPIYNPELTSDWSYNQDTQLYKLDSGLEISLPKYKYDGHPFFLSERARDLIGLHHAECNTDPIWQYDPNEGTLIITAYFKDYSDPLGLFLDWLSPKVQKVVEGEYNTQDDLEGPRYVTLSGKSLVIDPYSFTR